MTSLEEQKIKKICEKYGEIGIAYLFGSQVTGKTHAQSDYDIAVYFNEPDVLKRHNILFNLSSEISRVFQSDAIDIHSLNDLQNPLLKYSIIVKGKVIFEREPYRVIIEPRILNDYFDFTHHLKKYNLTKAL